MSEGNRAKTATAPAVAVLAMDTRYHEHIPTVLPFKPELKDVFEADEGARNETGRFSAALQAGFDAAGLDAEFFPDGRWKSVLVVNIGHPGPDPWFDRLPRLEPADVLRWA